MALAGLLFVVLGRSNLVMIQTGDWRRPRWLLIFTAFTAGLRRSVPVSPPLVSHPVRRFSLEILSAPRCDVATTTRTTFRFGFDVPQPGLRGTRDCRHRTHRSRCRRVSGLFVCAVRRRQKTHLTGVSEDLSGKFLKNFFRRLFAERSVFAYRANHNADVARQHTFPTAVPHHCLS